MRQFETCQPRLGETSIADIVFDPKSRDDVPQLLRGLQFLYVTPALRAEVFRILDQVIAPKISRRTGRPGMTLWRILVLGVVRLNLGWDYDRLQEMANQHRTLRQMLEHGADDETHYELQTLKDNVSLLTPEILDQINQVVVHAGQQLAKKKGDDEVQGRCDSFVVETDVHYPTDANLLVDALRKIIVLSARVSRRYGLAGWGKSGYNLRQVRRWLRAVQQGKSPRRPKETRRAYRRYLALARDLIQRGEETVAQLPAAAVDAGEEIGRYLAHAHRQVEQIDRRVLQGQTIPHAEKVFSLFEEHTEWISKGKAGVPVELGVQVAIVEDQYGFILHHRVMQGEGDAAIAVPLVRETQQRFPQLHQCSFDRGFYTPDNRTQLRALLTVSALPSRGTPSASEAAWEASEEFLTARRRHVAVESAINALEVHGLDRCPDHGIAGFRRYVALAVVGRNIQQLGAWVSYQAALARRRRRPRRTADPPSCRRAA